MTNAYLLTYLFTYLLTRWECPGRPKEIVEIPGWQTLATQAQQLSIDPIEIAITRWWNQRRCFLYISHRKLIRCPIKPTHYSWDHVYCSRCGRWWDVMVGGVLMKLWNRQRETAVSNASKLFSHWLQHISWYSYCCFVPLCCCFYKYSLLSL